MVLAFLYARQSEKVIANVHVNRFQTELTVQNWVHSDVDTKLVRRDEEQTFFVVLSEADQSEAAAKKFLILNWVKFSAVNIRFGENVVVMRKTQTEV